VELILNGRFEKARNGMPDFWSGGEANKVFIDGDIYFRGDYSPET